MKKLAILYIQELKNAFHSYIAYILLAVFIAISGFFFVTLSAHFSLISQQWKAAPGIPEMNFNLTEIVLTGLFVNVAGLALFFTPPLTMRSFAEEKRQGTLELLLTLPISDTEVVLGKFFSCYTLFVLMILPLWLYPLLIQQAGGYFEWATVASGFLGMLLLGASFISLGIFISSLTTSQVVSASLSFGAFLFLWMAGSLENVPELEPLIWLGNFSMLEHFKSLARGILDLRDIVFYLFFTLFFLYATTVRLEIRSFRR
ncbi:MAG: ABC transporter permease subunit [Candidatus Omnitrophica bacterium]|nr:ABC transporter permease subunit [Candidatus Omnitrophota bacterium]